MLLHPKGCAPSNKRIQLVHHVGIDMGAILLGSGFGTGWGRGCGDRYGDTFVEIMEVVKVANRRRAAVDCAKG